MKGFGVFLLVALTLAGIIATLIILRAVHRADACSDAGGVWVRSYSGHVCIDKRVVIQP